MAFMSKIYMLPHEAEPIVRRQLLGVLGQVLLQKQGVQVDTVEAYELRMARNQLIRTLKKVEFQKHREDAAKLILDILQEWSSIETLHTSAPWTTMTITGSFRVKKKRVPREPFDLVGQEGAFFESVSDETPKAV